MKVFVIGAAGGVGRRLTALLTGRSDEVTGLHRRPEQAEVIHGAGGLAVTGDLIGDGVEQLGELMVDHDAVVFSAGAHGTGTDQTTLIDGEGLRKAADAATRAGVRRFVLVSVFPDAGRGREPSEGFEHYMHIKKEADVHLTGTDLDWIVVRPGTLTDDEGTGTVRAGWAVPYGDVRRDDVAAFIAAALHEPRLHHVVVELTEGDTPVDQAVTALLA